GSRPYAGPPTSSQRGGARLSRGGAGIVLGMAIARPPVVSQSEWEAALAAMTERERKVAAEMHDLAAARKRMPMVRVGREYLFEGPDGQRSLPELFEGRSQLILYRFFFDHGVAGTAGKPPPLRGAHGLDARAVVHDPHRELLGRLRGRRVVRLQRVPARWRRRLPLLLPPARGDGPVDRKRLEPVVADTVRRA